MELVQIINQDGKAVPVKVVNGSTGGGGISGKNVENNEQINEVSFEVDDGGYPVLRVIDAAPFAYEPLKDVIKTHINGGDAVTSISPIDGTPISIEAGGYWDSPEYDIDDIAEIRLAIRIDTSAKFQVALYHLHGSLTLDLTTILDKVESPSQTGSTKAEIMAGKKFKLRISNKDTSNISVRVLNIRTVRKYV